MPASDRRPRRRLLAVEAVAESVEELHNLARIATPADWDGGLRRRLVRALVSEGQKHEVAVGIAGAYERKPYLIPMRRPPGSSQP